MGQVNYASARIPPIPGLESRAYFSVGKDMHQDNATPDTPPDSTVKNIRTNKIEEELNEDTEDIVEKIVEFKQKQHELDAAKESIIVLKNQCRKI